MNRARTSAIVLLLASAVAACEQDARADFEELDRVNRIEAVTEADRPGPRGLLGALVAWALGRDQRETPRTRLLIRAQPAAIRSGDRGELTGRPTGV